MTKPHAGGVDQEDHPEKKPLSHVDKRFHSQKLKLRGQHVCKVLYSKFMTAILPILRTITALLPLLRTAVLWRSVCEEDSAAAEAEEPAQHRSAL